MSHPGDEEHAAAESPAALQRLLHRQRHPREVDLVLKHLKKHNTAAQFLGSKFSFNGSHLQSPHRTFARTGMRHEKASARDASPKTRDHKIAKHVIGPISHRGLFVRTARLQEPKTCQVSSNSEFADPDREPPPPPHTRTHTHTHTHTPVLMVTEY